jgi:hypothetical protein
MPSTMDGRPASPSTSSSPHPLTSPSYHFLFPPQYTQTFVPPSPTYSQHSIHLNQNSFTSPFTNSLDNSSSRPPLVPSTHQYHPSHSPNPPNNNVFHHPSTTHTYIQSGHHLPSSSSVFIHPQPHSIIQSHPGFSHSHTSNSNTHDSSSSSSFYPIKSMPSPPSSNSHSSESLSSSSPTPGYSSTPTSSGRPHHSPPSSPVVVPPPVFPSMITLNARDDEAFERIMCQLESSHNVRSSIITSFRFMKPRVEFDPVKEVSMDIVSNSMDQEDLLNPNNRLFLFYFVSLAKIRDHLAQKTHTPHLNILHQQIDHFHLKIQHMQQQANNTQNIQPFNSSLEQLESTINQQKQESVKKTYSYIIKVRSSLYLH